MLRVKLLVISFLAVLATFVLVGLFLFLGGYVHTGEGVIFHEEVWYTLAGPDIESYSRPGVLYWRTRNWTFVTNKRRLYLNDVSYGDISRGEEVSVDWSGTIFVNGVRRSQKVDSGKP